MKLVQCKVAESVCCRVGVNVTSQGTRMGGAGASTDAVARDDFPGALAFTPAASSSGTADSNHAAAVGGIVVAAVLVLICLATTLILLRRKRRNKAVVRGDMEDVHAASALASHDPAGSTMPPPADVAGSSLGAHESTGGKGSQGAGAGDAEEVAPSPPGSLRLVRHSLSKEHDPVTAAGRGQTVHEKQVSVDGIIGDVEGRGTHTATDTAVADVAAALMYPPAAAGDHTRTAHKGSLPSQAASSMTATASEGAPSAGVRSSTGGVTTSFAAVTTAYNTAAAASETAVEERKERLRTELDHMRRRGELFLDHYMVLPWTERREGGQGIVQFMRCTRTDKAVATKFFLSRRGFETELELYEVDILRSMMPAVQLTLSNSNAADRNSRGYPWPPCIVLEKGESLQEWKAKTKPAFSTIVDVRPPVVLCSNSPPGAVRCSSRMHAGVVSDNGTAGTAPWQRVGPPGPEARKCAAPARRALLDPHGLWLRRPLRCGSRLTGAKVASVHMFECMLVFRRTRRDRSWC